MATPNDAAENTRQQILDARSRGVLATLATYTRLSGPGWLQGAITLGGGSLAGALYLGVIMGYGMMWLQPVAMVLGVIMLSAISYVVLSTGERPFGLLNTHISPVLGWAWLIATMMANVVWCLPQFALGTAAVQQNLAPATNTDTGTAVVAGVLLLIAAVVVWSYNSGSKGIRIFEMILKSMVGVVVLSFFGVVVALTWRGQIDWPAIIDGFVPRLTYLFEPAPTLGPAIQATSDPEWWNQLVATTQKDKIITAFATAAVSYTHLRAHETFLLPYSMLRKGWNADHRGLAIFDLSIGLIVPYVLATGCVVIAAASQFHGRYDDVFAMLETGKGKEVAEYHKFVDQRLKAKLGDEFVRLQAEPTELAAARKALPEGDRRMAAMLAARDNQTLAATLEPLAGAFAQKLFGIGVLGMALSTIIILMLINGFAFAELIGAEPQGWAHRVGTMIPALGVLGPFVWSEAAPKLATPTSVFGGAMLPIAYLSFLLLMNSRRTLGDAMPTGRQRVLWNLLMCTATSVAILASIWSLQGKMFGSFPIGAVAIGVLVTLMLVGVASFIVRNNPSHPS